MFMYFLRAISAMLAQDFCCLNYFQYLQYNLFVSNLICIENGLKMAMKITKVTYSVVLV